MKKGESTESNEGALSDIVSNFIMIILFYLKMSSIILFDIHEI